MIQPSATQTAKQLCSLLRAGETARAAEAARFLSNSQIGAVLNVLDRRISDYLTGRLDYELYTELNRARRDIRRMETRDGRWTYASSPELMQRLEDAQARIGGNVDICSIVGCMTTEAQLLAHVERYEAIARRKRSVA